MVAAGSAPARAAPYEPNETMAQATGPIIGGASYYAAIETTNDEDWFRFNATGQQLDIAVTLDHDPGCPALYAQLKSSDGRDAGGATLTTEGQTSHIRYTPAAGRYYLGFSSSSCAGMTYHFRIDPASAVSTQPPPPPPPPPASNQGPVAGFRVQATCTFRDGNTIYIDNECGSVFRPRVGETLLFTSTSSDPDGRITALNWDLNGDGTFSPNWSATTSYVFRHAGVRTVRLRATDDKGATSTASLALRILTLECYAALRSRDTTRENYQAARRRYARAHRPAVRRRLAKWRRYWRRALDRQNQRVWLNCQ
jgi:PKD domain-containing protein